MKANAFLLRSPPGSIAVSKRLRTNSHTLGFTLPEALLASTVLAFVVAALTQAVLSGQMQAYDAMHESRAVSLAEAMLDEVLALPYADPDGPSVAGPDAGETTRQLFDNADDYHGYTEAAEELADHEGTLYPDTFQKFTRSITAQYTTVNIPTFGPAQAGLLITVTITDDADRTWTLTRFVAEPAS
jgi:Tfp pilus assembly protein PilV